ncbi:hypothetical protein D7X74_26175 [Corallococcus sp. CA047B]|uniref:hypothetical protein n=1 Tax=Corallococcus sp. CA047B TaxID=2316729 RepID=UPI000EA2EFA5|nr:hypothetical protein [Corallococcus sp. CA047B]RKH11075.1 hypothetical protein D7X74_26175 [Corallococcus sp. CA047B]
MPGFGPFDTFSDALVAACPLILSKPHATAGRERAQDFRVRWRISKEYCAWLYYTPAGKYEMSMLTDQSEQDELDRRKSCLLPETVDDARFPMGSIKYVFALHNHPYEGRLSDGDIRMIVSMGRTHEWVVEVGGKKVPLSVVAFFSNSDDLGQPSCDGFFQYIPVNGELKKWTGDGSGGWRQELLGTVTWQDEEHYRIDEK